MLGYMKTRMKEFLFWFCALLPVCLAAGIRDQVRIDLFTEPGCGECEKIKREVLPKLEEEFEGQYELTLHDTTKEETIPLLVAYMDRCGVTQNAAASIVVDHTRFLAGYETVSTGLLDVVDGCLASRQVPGWKPPDPPAVEGAGGSATVEKRLSGFTVPVVALAGLLDGFNPCAISTLIFFLSVLAISKAAVRTRLLVGVSFIFASFLVYMGLGLGFFYTLRSLPGFPVVKLAINAILGLCLIPLAYLSLRDSFRFRKTQRASDVSLQIPDSVKKRIHSFMNERLGWGGPVIGGLVVGAGVTVLESVCTGQSYVPTLMFIIKDSPSNLRAWWLLALYNLLFVLPLIVVFVLFHRGLQIPKLLEWSKRNLVTAKILLGLFFALMAVLLLWEPVAKLIAYLTTR